MNINLQIDASAVPQTPINDGIQTRCGFAFGNDEFNNPISFPDPPIYNTAGNVFNSSFVFDSTIVTPQIASVDKNITNITGERERATGPNHPVTYNITSEIATGADTVTNHITNFILEYTLPDQFVISSIADPGTHCTISYTPDIGPEITDGGTCDPSAMASGPPYGPAGRLKITFDDNTVNSGDTPGFSFTGYVTDVDVNSNNVLDPLSGASKVINNSVTLNGDYGGSAFSDDSGIVSFTAKSLVVNKSAEISINSGDNGYTPGDIILYTLDIDVSDYFEFNDLDLRDTIDDGLEYLDDSLTIQVTEAGTTDATRSTTNFTEVGTTEGNYGTFDPFDFSDCDGAASSCQLAIVDDNSNDSDGVLLDDGDTLLALDISQILDDLSSEGNDSLSGSDTLGQAGQLTIKYNATILEAFIKDMAPRDNSVDGLDILNNSVALDGVITAIGGGEVSDTSGSSITIVTPNFSKNIVHIEGGGPAVSTGDDVTFEFMIEIPSGDTEDLVLTDFLPQPVFLSTGLTFDIATLSTPFNGTYPAAGHIGYSNATTVPKVAGDFPTPTISTPNTTSFQVDWDDNSTFQRDSDNGSVISLYATFKVEDKAFDDGLSLVNFASLQIGNSVDNATANASGAIDMEIEAPELTILKEITASSNANSVIVNGDISEVETGDTLTYVMTVENIGDGEAHNVALKDTLPAELINPAIVTVLDEAGDPVANDGGNFFGAGLGIAPTIGPAGSGAEKGNYYLYGRSRS